MKFNQEIHCVVNVDVADAAGILQLITDTAKNSHLLKKHKNADIYRLFEKREQVVSTAVGNGIAIPHCFIEGLEDFVIGVITVSQGVDFDAPDGEPVNLFFFIIGPASQRNRHVSILSEISRTMQIPANREILLRATTNEALQQQVSQLLSLHHEKADEAYCEIRILIQGEELFEPVLEELSAHVDGNVAVQELRSARSYLHHMPLFATLWSSDVDENVRMILAVIDKKLVNEIARRIQQLSDELQIPGSVLVTAQELLYKSGGIDF